MMALIICTGFVVDDAIVVVENISRHIEEGMTPMQAALKGSHEIGFTILSMTSSLIAVFIPLLLMGGVVGKLFREFAVTLSVALAISMFVSLTLTPMLCSRLFRKDAPKPHRMPNGRRWPQTVMLDWISSGLRKLHTAYVASLGTVMKHKLLTMVILLLTIVGNVFLYITIDKGLFPDQDTGILFGMVRADQQTSFTQMDPKILRLSKMLEKDPAIEYVLASTGGGGFGSRNTGQFFIQLKPLDQRTETASQVANRLFALSKRMPGTSLFLMPVQDFRTGGRSANATYQYSIQSDDLATLRQWSTPIYKALSKLPELTSVDSDAETGGSEVKVIVDREAATRYGLNAREIDTFLNDAFAQRQIATQYKMLNQYYSVIGLDSSWTQDPSVLTRLFVVTSAGKQIPVSNFAHIEYSTTPLSVDHEDQTATTTIAFNLADGVSLDTAKAAIDRTMASLGLPDSVYGSFAGTAATFQKTMGQIPLLILTAILVIYILLGILYESWIHPITILSTLPSAGIGALLLMEITGTQFTVIAFIGILLLIGIVKKNAILMVDFAIAAEREGRTPEEAIIEACRKRFRPILMTSCAAFFGAVPLLLQTGSNASFHRPLGIAICGGLVVSQVLTLYTTPVVYVYLDRFGSWAKRLWRRFFKGNGTAAAVTAGK
ncbi:acriflavin resistance protein AcrB/AcrD/AcrF family [Sutterella sp. CAG:351]|nr:acriflavin resistance protein AcrB/AcrD/AcrF family [Sutterella sp. CAG:351]